MTPDPLFQLLGELCRPECGPLFAEIMRPVEPPKQDEDEGEAK